MEAFYDQDQGNWVILDNLSSKELILVDLGDVIRLRDELTRIIDEELKAIEMEGR